MLLVIYIIGCTLMTVACIYRLTNPVPKDTTETLQDALLMLVLVLLWPGIIVIYLLSILLLWISGD